MNSRERKNGYRAREQRYNSDAPQRTRDPRYYDEAHRDDDYPERNRYDERYYQPDYRRSSGGKKFIIAAVLALGVAAGAIGAYKIFMTPPPIPQAQILSVGPNYIFSKKAYNSCHKVATTTYVQNQKDGTDGALIGGATGAVAGGVIGNQIKQGGGGTAVGAIVGGLGGALVGREVQRSNQPDYVAKKSSYDKCGVAYKTVKHQSGYKVQYLYENATANIITQSPLTVGAKLPLNQLQSMAQVTTQ
jgi:uncharacterized protein YcfJ